MGLLDKIKSDVKQSGSNKGKLLYFREGEKVRVRFLTDLDEGIVVTFHNSYERNIMSPCQEAFGRHCPYCGDDDLKTREMYCWSVYDYEANEIKLILQAANSFSPVPQLVAMYENYGTMLDRDYVIQQQGRATSKSFTVIPQDKVRFKNSKVKKLTESAMYKIIDKAYPAETDEENGEDAPKTNARRKKASKPKASANDYEDDTDVTEADTDDWDGADDTDNEYEGMSAKELYKLCKERLIDVPARKTSEFYTSKLIEYDEAQDDWDEEVDEAEDEAEDDWDE